MTDPRQYEFWRDEFIRMLNIITPTALDVFTAGAEAGVALLPPALTVLVDWDWFNQEAVNWLEKYGIGTLKDIHGTTEANTVKIIGDWVKSGKRLDVLKSQLNPWFGEKRAERIAVTEVTRMYAEGNITAWKAAGIVGKKRWQTAMDEKVCPICGPLHGMEVGVDENGFTTEAFGMGLYGPPAHVNCRCWLLPVVDLDLVDQAFKRELGL